MRAHDLLYFDFDEQARSLHARVAIVLSVNFRFVFGLFIERILSLKCSLHPKPRTFVYVGIVDVEGVMRGIVLTATLLLDLLY